MLHQIKAPQFYTDLGLQNPPVSGKIQGLFQAFECLSSIFQGKFYFQGLFKTVLYIQVLFKPTRTLMIDVLFGLWFNVPVNSYGHVKMVR